MTSRQSMANAIRFLSIDAVQLANSGHPGMPMGMADIAQVLWADFLSHNPKDPQWVNRDRFILSNGHGSMLLYSLLHLTGYDLQMDDLKNFRKLHSRTPGHPEVGITPGVEVTTGPLGQGLGCAVGCALAEQLLSSEYNEPEHEIIDHYTYCFVGDGCLMEGISHEVSSFAGTLGLNKLIVLWDDNGISIDGEVKNWSRDNVEMRFRAYGWNVIEGIDGHDYDSISSAISKAKESSDKPTLICCRTTIGHGSPSNAGHCKVHGAPLGADEVIATRENLQWQHEPFVVSQEIYNSWDATKKGQSAQEKWHLLFEKYKQSNPEKAKELQRRWQNQLPTNFSAHMHKLLESVQSETSPVATRKASQIVLDSLSQELPELLGGSADLSGSNLTKHKNARAIEPQKVSGNYIYYGVREFGMSVIMNGLALHGAFIPYGGTFLTFLDYARNAIRMSGLMHQRVIYVYSHDSIGLGEDGPTHQPIEHLTMLRITPNVSLWRPCDLSETVVAWQSAIERDTGPTCLALSRQKLECFERDKMSMSQIKQGGYILYEPDQHIDAIIIATGSEVSMAVNAAKELQKESVGVRVVSMPCVDVFKEQSSAYKEEVLPDNISARVAVEAGSPDYWYQFVGTKGAVVGIEEYGRSAPCQDVYNDMGITVNAVKSAVLQCLK